MERKDIDIDTEFDAQAEIEKLKAAVDELTDGDWGKDDLRAVKDVLAVGMSFVAFAIVMYDHVAPVVGRLFS